MTMLDAETVIGRLCRLQEKVWHSGNGGWDAADCFCRKGGFWKCADYDGTYKNGYRNSGECLEFIEKAVEQALREPSFTTNPPNREGGA